MDCPECQTARTYPENRMFNPACIFCGARLIQILGNVKISAAECKRRRKDALRVWVEHGHSEQTIRSLVDGPLAIGPDTGSVHPTSTKPLSPKRRR